MNDTPITNTNTEEAVIINKAISNKLGNSKYYRTKVDERSSLLQPTEQFAEYYASGDWNKVINITEIETTTVIFLIQRYAVQRRTCNSLIKY